MTLGALLRKPSAFTPLAMSLAALALIVAVVATVGVTSGVTQPHDERTPARIFQLLLVLQAPVVAAFAIKWLPRAPRPAALVLLMQAGAALLAVATIIRLEW